MHYETEVFIMTNPINDDLEFEKMVSKKMSTNFGSAPMTAAEEATSERLKEMNKKLPSWNLEPPFTFIK